MQNARPDPVFFTDPVFLQDLTLFFTSYSYADLTADKTRIEQAKAQLILENPDTYKDMPEYKALVNETREVSELGGTIAGKAAAERLGDAGSPNVSLLAQWPDGSKNVNFDDVRRMTIDGQEVLVIIENKGGEAVLGKRLTGEGEYAQQGTPEYHYSLMKSMDAKIERLNEDSRNIPGSQFEAQLNEIKNMFNLLQNQPVRFYHVQQKFDIHGNPAGVIVDRFPDIPADPKK